MNKLKAFTISELMVTLALTSIMTVFAYMGYNYIGRLLKQFNEQSTFINQLSELDKRFALVSVSPGEITSNGDNTFHIQSDSAQYALEFKEHYILFGRTGMADTFHLEAANIVTELEPERFNSALIRKISFEVDFERQKFNLQLTKVYDAVSKLKRELEN